MDIVQHLPQDFSFDVSAQVETLMQVETPLYSSSKIRGMNHFLMVLALLLIAAFIVYWVYKTSYKNEEQTSEVK